MKSDFINKELLAGAYSYKEYYEMLLDLFEKGKTTGENQSKEMLAYAKLNLQRMKRLNKTAKLNDSQKVVLELKEEIEMLVISEGWCGDASQSLAYLNLLAEQNKNLNLSVILRDNNLELMDEFLTNGGRSIPKVIFLRKENLEILGDWGPRPAPLQKIYTKLREGVNSISKEEISKELQLWYNKDKGETTIEEVVKILIQQ